MDLAVQKSPGSQHNGTAAELDAHLRNSTHHPLTFNQQVVNGLLEQPQVGLVLKHPTNGRFIQNAVGLRPGGAHSWALAGVEDAELDTAFVGGQRHRTTHRIDLFDQVAFADPANRGIAAHLTEGLDVVAEQ